MLIEYIVFFGLIIGCIILALMYKGNQSLLTADQWERLRTESPIERKLFDGLVRSGITPKTQVRCGRYRIDMALLEYGIALEADGKAYHTHPSQRARDKRRDEYLNQQGWKVLRFTGSEIHSNIQQVIDRIKIEIEKSKGTG